MSKDRVGVNHNWRGRAFRIAFFHTMRFGFWNLAWSVHPFTYTIGTFPFQLPFGDINGNVCAYIGANLFGGAKRSRLSTISFVYAAGIGREKRQRPRW